MALALVAYLKFAPALLLAVILAVVCRPLYEALYRALTRRGPLEHRPGMAHGLSSFITQLLASVFLAICILVPLWVLTLNRKVILTSAQSAMAEGQEWSRREIQTLGQRFQIKAWEEFGELPGPNSVVPMPVPGANQEPTFQDNLVEMVSRPGPFLPFALRTLGTGALWLGQVMFFSMALHFLLLHGPRFWDDVLSRSPKGWRPTLTALSKRGRTVLMATCVVHGLSAVSAFLLALPVFWIIAGREHFLLLAMLAGFFQFVPLLGSATLVSLMTLYYFASGLQVQAWESLLLAFPLIVGVPDLVIRPYLAGRFGKVHSLTMLAGFITGFEVFGPLGFVLGPLFLDLIVQYTVQILGTKKEL